MGGTTRTHKDGWDDPNPQVDRNKVENNDREISLMEYVKQEMHG